MEIAKLMLVQNNSDNNAEQAVSTDEALNSVLKKKLLVRDAAERGFVIDDAEIEQSLADIRENLGVTDNGTVTKNDEVQKLLKESGLTYSEYEKAIEMNLPYALLYYDYAKLLYEELSQKQSDVVFGDEMVDAYLETLLTELKSNS